MRDRAFRFAVRVVRLGEFLMKRRGAAPILGDQLVRAGTSVGANIEEAQAAHTRREFSFKISLAAREAREAHYWLRLISSSDIIAPSRIASLIDEANQLAAILASITHQTRVG